MKIFYGEKDINYNNPAQYAFLNWRFDDSMGKNDKNNPLQKINDNFEMGKAYIADAIITLYSIIKSRNTSSVADTLIFPVLFNIWHGIELWLKCSINILNCITNIENKNINTHDIYKLFDILKEKLVELKLNQTAETALTELELLINEFRRVNAHFDFARYSFDTQGNFQFYNAPFGDDKQWQKDLFDDSKQIVPNTCVKLDSLFDIILHITEHFEYLIEYLRSIITDENPLSDECYMEYINTCKKYENMLNSKNDDETDPINRIMNLICWHII
ncbi:hypothetical protein [uncultured Eubacterium sp.]|uniref:hypothetical protein n=1 Tax=uncultured Eubacterium sp. TaxID=165185 RepID=UPI0025F8EF86|nr:hypothetical protein [uncultured Eubacterium sp.]